jgi:malonate transporter and related proteins
MSVFLQYFILSAPLFAVVLVGYVLARLPFWKTQWSAWASKAVFNVLLPAMLFHLMSGLRSMPPVNAAVLIAFFGGCVLVFLVGRVVSARVFKLDGVGQSIFAMGGIFSNNVLLGLPLVKITLGEAAVPSAALVIVFNAFTLWTLVSISVEWAKHASFSAHGIGKMALGIITSPLVAGIVGGTIFGLVGLSFPAWLDYSLDRMGDVAGPSALLVLGMGLVQYGVRSGLQLSLSISVHKLIVFPLTVWLLATLLRLGTIETQAIVVLASMSTGANVYLMATQFERLQGAIAGAIVVSTAIAAVTTPLILSAMAAVL